MKAAVYTEYGPPEVITVREVAKPAPKANDLLIKIHATTVNRTDCGFRKPEYPVIIRLINGILKPRKQILGSEFSGIVEAVGSEVRSFKPGDTVFGMSTQNFGTHAEYICLPESGSVALKPSTMTFEEAAAVCEGLMLANAYLKYIDFTKRPAILVNGASGSIGSAGVQLAKHYGASVTAVCNTKNIDLIRSLGAESAIDYTQVDFTQDDGRFDVVFDAVGKSSFPKCKRILKPKGVYCSTELGFMGQNVFFSIVTPMFGGKRVNFPLPAVTKKDIEFFKEIIEAGHYRAVIDRVYPLDEIVEAARYVESGQKTGNVVIRVSG